MCELLQLKSSPSDQGSRGCANAWWAKKGWPSGWTEGWVERIRVRKGRRVWGGGPRCHFLYSGWQFVDFLDSAWRILSPTKTAGSWWLFWASRTPLVWQEMEPGRVCVLSAKLTCVSVLPRPLYKTPWPWPCSSSPWWSLLCCQLPWPQASCTHRGGWRKGESSASPHSGSICVGKSTLCALTKYELNSPGWRLMILGHSWARKGLRD